MKPDEKETSPFKANIPESVFEEALRAVEKIQAEVRSAPAEAATPPSKAKPAIKNETAAKQLSDIMQLLDSNEDRKTAESTARPASPPDVELESDLQLLSNLLEEEYNLEKEAEFFKSVLFDDLQGNKAKIDESLLKEKEDQIQVLMDRLTKLQSEFEKFRQRLTKEAEITKRFSNEALILKILPILDNLERAIEHADTVDKNSAMIQGVRLIHKQLMDALMSAGMQAIDAMGHVFDPNYHEAITTVETAEMPPNIVIAEYQKGYMLFDRLIRPTRVVVSMRQNNQGAQAEKPVAPAAPTGAVNGETKLSEASESGDGSQGT